MILEVQRKRKNDQMIQFKEPTSTYRYFTDIQAQTASLEGMLKTVGSPDEAMDMAYKEMVLSTHRKGYQTFLKTFKLSTGSYFISLFRRKRSNRNRRSLDIKCR